MDTDDAETAYERVLADAGASFPQRDSADVNVINTVIYGTGSIIDDENEVGGYPVLESATPPADTDHDGMPDEWELAKGLDPDDAGDSAEDRNGDGYTNVEEYINWICSTAVKADLDDDFEVDLEDFAMFAGHWSEINCDEQNNWCGGADLTRDGKVGLDDLREFVANWLAGY